MRREALKLTSHHLLMNVLRMMTHAPPVATDGESSMVQGTCSCACGFCGLWKAEESCMDAYHEE